MSDDPAPDEPASPSFSLRPVFVPGPCLVSVLPLAAFVALWGGGFFGGLVHFLLSAFGLQIDAWVPFGICGGVLLVALPLVFLSLAARAYARTEYRFHEDRLEIRDGPERRQPRRVRLADVEAVEVQVGALQRSYGLGTVVLVTCGEPRLVRLVDVTTPDEVRGRVSGLVERCRGAAEPARSAA